MANPADPKAAALTEELREYALSLPTSVFPKNFFCALCNELSIDPFKLLCCNKSICASCQAKLQFPATCPSCEHSPLEEDSCEPNKALRNTMRVWLQKRKQKEDKATSQAATPIVEEKPRAPEGQLAGETADKSSESVEAVAKIEDAPVEQARSDGDHAGEAGDADTAPLPEQVSKSPQSEAERRGSNASKDANENQESMPGPDDTGDMQNSMDGSGGGMFGNNPMMNMNGMPGQFGYGFNSNQGNFNGMGWNGMPNMMGNWNNINPMDFNAMNGMNGMPNMPNGMFGGFGGNMGMGMNDMSAMNMMQFGGGYGHGWGGMGGQGYGDFNKFNQMTGYNQSGAYPQMPKNNFQNSHFNSNGGAYPHRNNRKGSQGGYGPGSGFQNANSRPGSRSGPQNRDGQSPDETSDAAAHTIVKDEQAKASAEPASEGKDYMNDKVESTPFPTAQTEEGASSVGVSNDGNNLTGAGDETGTNQSGGLNQIQTIDSVETDTQNYDQSMMNDVMQPGMQYSAMMNQYPNQMGPMNGQFNHNMGYNQNNYGSRGGFNPAYGAATVLTGEPRGLGVEGAPKGPRAMREGRPNTGFSSRMNNTRYQAPAPSATPTQQATPSSPAITTRRSPQRDDNLRTKDKSPSRSRSRSRAKEENKTEQRERSCSIELEYQSQDRGRSVTPKAEDDYGDYKRHEDRHRHRSSRYEDHKDQDVPGEDYDDRYREDRSSRGDRTRSTSIDSKHRSRRDKDKQRSSRSHRDRSREHRRRHRSRSRSPAAEERYEDDAYADGTDESSSRRKGRSDKHRERDRDRSRDRDRDRDRRDRKERDYDRDYDYEKKDRSRDKDKERRRRREREADDDRNYEDDKHRSSRRSRKERDRERDRDRDDREYEKEPSSATSIRPMSPPLNAPTGPSADAGFSIKGISKKRDTQPHMPPPQPPTGPRAFQPPKGPAADRDKERRDSRDHRRKSSVSSIPSTPTTPTVNDHYAAERERNARERSNFDKTGHDTSLQARTTSGHSSRSQLSTKRSRDDFETSSAQDGVSQDRPLKVPTGPASHREKRQKSGGGSEIADLLTARLRKNAGKRGDRRGGIKTEGDTERELERVERERDSRRW